MATSTMDSEENLPPDFSEALPAVLSREQIEKILAVSFFLGTFLYQNLSFSPLTSIKFTLASNQIAD